MLTRAVQVREVPDAGVSCEDALLERLYRARGVTDAQQLDLSLSNLLPIASLTGVAEALNLLLVAKAEDWPMVIVGDYDADGATATALMMRALTAFGYRQVRYLVPDRQTMGYGLTEAMVEMAHALKPAPKLIITVDNGISSHAGVTLANQLGMTVLITDHHLPGEQLPPAAVIVNPNLPGSSFPSKVLAGVGVAFYVMAALGKALEQPNAIVSGLLDLVALGTVADVVPLDHNNRILVRAGLLRIRQGSCQVGIKALVSVAKRQLSRLQSQDLGFAIGPRLNAAGRLLDMSIGIECLLCDDYAQALQLSNQLNEINLERRLIEASMQTEALQAVDRLMPAGDPTKWPAAISLYAEDWHSGVVGLVAAKVRERVHRPVAAFAKSDDGTVRGSVRSVPGVHIRDMLVMVATRHPNLMQSFGGHAMAAGLTLAEEQLKTFAKAFADAVAQTASAVQLSGLILTDGELPKERLNLATAELLAEAGPFGSGFPEPLFVDTFEVVDFKLLNEVHLKLWLRMSRDKPPVEAMYFSYRVTPRPLPKLGQSVRVCYQLAVNEYQEQRNLQLLISDLLLHEPTASAK